MPARNGVRYTYARVKEINTKPGLVPGFVFGHPFASAQINLLDPPSTPVVVP